MGRVGCRQEAEQEPRRPRRDDEPEQPADPREHGALDEQLADDAAAAGAEGQAHGDLFLPGRRPRDQQAGHVGARDQQHAADDAQQQPQRLGELLPDRRSALRRRQQVDAALQELLARVRRRLAERRLQNLLFEDAVEVRLKRRPGLFDGDARLQPAEHVHPAAPPVLHVVPVRRHLRLHQHRHAHARDVADVHAVEAGLRHADDGERVVVDGDRLPDDPRIGAESRAPVVVAQHGDRAAASLAIVVRCDDASHRGADAEHLEVRAGDELARHTLGLAVHADVHRDRTPGEQPGEDGGGPGAVGHCQADAREGRGRAAIDEVVAEIFVHRERQHVAARVAAVVVPRAVEEDELLGVFHREAPQEHLVDEREDGGIGADAEGDRHERDAREQRRSGEPAESVSKVPDQIRHTDVFSHPLQACQPACTAFRNVL